MSIRLDHINRRAEINQMASKTVAFGPIEQMLGSFLCAKIALILPLTSIFVFYLLYNLCLYFKAIIDLSGGAGGRGQRGTGGQLAGHPGGQGHQGGSC